MFQVNYIWVVGYANIIGVAIDFINWIYNYNVIGK